MRGDTGRHFQERRTEHLRLLFLKIHDEEISVHQIMEYVGPDQFFPILFVAYP